MTEKENSGGKRYTALYIMTALLTAAAVIAAAAAVFVILPREYRHIEDETAQSSNIISPGDARPLDQAGELTAGGLYTLGSYPQNTDSPEPIVWRVLGTEDGRALLVSEYLLDARRYDGSDSKWKESELREWLCGEFLDTAFSEEERGMLVMADGDAVSILNVGQAKKYFKTDAERMAAPTLYAIRHGAAVGDVYMTEDGLYTGWWWLRTPGFNKSIMASFVDFGGSIYEGGDSVDSKYYCVRPVITVMNGMAGQPRPDTPDGSGAEPLDGAAGVTVGGYFTFGRYPQGREVSPSDAEDSPEPVVWRVLEVRDGCALAVSEYLLDARRFDGESGVWEHSELREWLCGEFAQTAFSPEERKRLEDIDGDRVSLLTVSEAGMYFDSWEDRVAITTAYAGRDGTYARLDDNAGDW